MENFNMSQDERDWTLLLMLLGWNRTGKSVTAEEIAKKWRQANKKGKVYSYDPQNRFTNVTNYKIELNANWAKTILEMSPRRALIILDDYRILHSSDKMNEDFLKLLGYRSEWGLDIICVSWYPSLVLERLSYFISHYYIFLTQGSDEGFQKKVSNRHILTKCVKLINKYVKKYGKGDYPNFPHIIFDNQNDIMNLINMDNIKL